MSPPRASVKKSASLAGVFAMIAVTGAGLVAATGAGLYAVSAQIAREAALNANRIAAEATARNLAQAMGMIGEILDRLAQEPGLCLVARQAEQALLRSEEERLTRTVPGALLVRLLAETASELDEQRAPRMGFADLDMARQARTGKPLPAVHTANSPDAHLALARAPAQGGCVILASLSPKLLDSSIPAAIESGAMELQQQTLKLAFKGDPGLQPNPPDGLVAVPGTPWTLAYWGPASVNPEPGWFALIPAAAVLLLWAATYWAYRRTVGALIRDQEAAIRAADDVLAGRTPLASPVQLKEMQRLTALLDQVKRAGADAFSRPDKPKLVPKIGPLPEGTPDDLVLEPMDGEETAPLPPPNLSPTIFRAYDIRGVVGETLTTDAVQWIGRAVGSEVLDRGEQRVAIARDGRLSSAEFSRSLARGLMDAGCTVVDLGLAPTPVLYFATHVLDTRSGVMITGSHNPSHYNGLKIVIGGNALAEESIQRLKARILLGDLREGRGQMDYRKIIPEYVERVVHDVHVGRPLKIVVDCGNGVASEIAPKLLEELGCEVVRLYCVVDGNFPNHHPDPSNPDNLKTLVEVVTAEHADLGVAFDGDGDRLGVVDSSGKIIWPDRQMMIFAAEVLAREPGTDIVFDVKCTRHLATHIIRHGGRPLMWKSGHSLIKAKMKETEALLAGELSGHICFKDRWFGFDDGLYACARLVEILSNDERTSAEVFAELPDSINTPELNVALDEGEGVKFMEKLRELASFPGARVTDIDGLRVDFADGWGLVRASNTTPSLVVRFEADNEEALRRIESDFRDLMQKVKPDLELPF